jgi:cytochrome c-type biogenesis protein CcmF
MLPELGHLALVLALAVAVAQGVVPMLGASRGEASWMRFGTTAAVAQTALVAFAFAILIRSFVVSDFTVENVVANSHSLKPLIYKVSGAWGSHEGSLVLWVLILSLFGALVGLFGENIPAALKARTLGVQGWISIGFLSFLVLTSNPFERVVPAPLEGNELNPLLQDFGLALHPPMLYLGYVGFSIVFSFAIAALIEGRVDPAWARWVRPWTLAAWVFLTGGIALGSWWAYYELGWGGWWFWDPVENVSFMPWLLGTALLHSAIVVEKRGAFKSWTILLAILTFSLSLLGTFIVRSGLLTSVHAFAVDPERGMYILGLLALSIGGSLALYAWRAPQMERGGLYAPVSRETGLLINNLLLSVAAATVLFGTLFPLFMEALAGDKVSVGPPYFNATFVPLMLPLVLVMGFGPFLPWKRADLGAVAEKLKFVALVSAAAALVAWWLDTGGPALAAVAVGLGVWLLLATLSEWADRVRLFRAPWEESLRRARNLPRATHGMTLAHAGLAVAIFGFVGASAWKQEVIVAGERGDRFEIAGYELAFEGVGGVQGPNYQAARGRLDVFVDGERIDVLLPEVRFYPAAESSTTEAAIRQTLLGDLYVAIGEQREDDPGRWTLRLYYEPLVGLIWAGAVMLCLGGLVSLSDRRLRVGAPRRAAAAAAPSPSAVPAE